MTGIQWRRRKGKALEIVPKIIRGGGGVAGAPPPSPLIGATSHMNTFETTVLFSSSRQPDLTSIHAKLPFCYYYHKKQQHALGAPFTETPSYTAGYITNNVTWWVIVMMDDKRCLLNDIFI